jgi:hypothetical protein
VSPWLDLLGKLDVEGGQDVSDRLMDELAFMVQFPGKKINHGILLGGAEGIGKDSWLAPVLSAIGTHNVRVIHGEDLAGDFQGWLAGSKMVVVNEVRFGSHRDREKIAERLKPLAAAPPDELHVNEKNLRPYWVPNRVQLVGMTNHRDAIHAADGTRRYFCVWSKLSIPQGDREVDVKERTRWEDYFKRYWAWLEHGGRQAVYGWLLARPVAHVNPGARPMRTPWLEDMIDLGRDPVTAWLYEQIECGRVPFDGPRVALSQIIVTAENARSQLWGQLPPLDARNVALAMSRLGHRGERKTTVGSRDTLYILRNGQPHESVSLGNVIDLDAHRGKKDGGLIDSAAWI